MANMDEMRIASSEAKNEFGRLLDEVSHGGTVVITRYDTPRAVLMSYERYEQLSGATSQALADLTSEYDAWYERMQSPKARRAKAEAYAASTEAMGRASKVGKR